MQPPSKNGPSLGGGPKNPVSDPPTNDNGLEPHPMTGEDKIIWTRPPKPEEAQIDNQTLTFDGSTAKLYINGIQVASDARSWNTSQNKAYIGRQVNDFEFLDGGLKQVLLYDRVLSDAEILQNYNIDSPRFS